MDNTHQLLKVLVGSRAHGLSNENSDYDYRSVHILQTSDLLSLDYKSEDVKGSDCNVSYEIGHFLHLALECNPTILEVFKAPIISEDNYVATIGATGYKLRSLFPYVWQPERAYLAFVGYGLDQRRRFLDKSDGRQDKYACAYIRTLYNLIQLLETGDFSVEIKEPEIRKTLISYKSGNYKTGEVVDKAEWLTKLATASLGKSVNKEYNRDIVNQFLLNIRKSFWTTKGG
jgi:hypothetical protein